MMTFQNTWLRKILIGIAGFVSVFMLLAVFQPKNTATKIKHIEFNNIVENRLRFKVNVETTGRTDVMLKYWNKSGCDTLFSSVSKDKEKHTLWIVNILEQKDYQFQKQDL